MHVEQITGKGLGKEISEDAVGNFENCYWVLDGASVPGGLKSDSIYNASWFVKSLSRELTNSFSKNREADLRTILKDAIRQIKVDLSSVDFSDSIQPCATIALTRILKQRIQYLVLGDSFFVFKNDENIIVETDNRIKNFGQPFRAEAFEIIKSGEGFNSEKFSEAKKNLVLGERNAMNTFQGYWVAGLDEHAPDFAIEGEVMFKEKFEVFLFTDGFGRLVTRYNQYSDFEDLANAVNRKGLTSLVKEIRKIEQIDLTGSIYPRLSWSDDATCIHLKNS